MALPEIIAPRIPRATHWSTSATETGLVRLDLLDATGRVLARLEDVRETIVECLFPDMEQACGKAAAVHRAPRHARFG